jgi:uncharacterized protein YxjI
MTGENERIRAQVDRSGATEAFPGGGTLFTEPVLVVNRKTKISELANEYAVFDAGGAQLGAVRQTGQTTLKSTVVVQRPDGSDAGRIVQENMIGKIRFGIEADGKRMGAIQGENWIAWDFSIKDETGEEVARITKTWEGLARTAFTTGEAGPQAGIARYLSGYPSSTGAPTSEPYSVQDPS